MGRGDFCSDLSERNKEAFSSFSMSQDRLSLFLFISSCLHHLPLFLFLSLCIHRLSLDFIASLPSPHFVPSLFTVLPRFGAYKIISWNFLISSPLFLCFFLRVLIASLCFYLGVCLGLTGYFFFNFFYNERLLNRLNERLSNGVVAYQTM